METRMDFEKFKEIVVDSIMDYVYPIIDVDNIELSVVTKRNGVKLTGLNIRAKDEKASPIIYLEQFYSDYLTGEDDIHEVLKKIAAARMNIDTEFYFEDFLSFESNIDRIYPRLCSVELNEEFLSTHPYVEVADMAVTFAIEIDRDSTGVMTVAIDSNLMEKWNVRVNDLYEVAIENLVNANSGIFKSMLDTLCSFYEAGKLEKGEVEEMLLNQLEDSAEPMYVLANKIGSYGSNEILNKNLMDRIAEKIGDRFYILPSSIHEVIILPEKFVSDVEYLRTMVREVNNTEVASSDILSYSVYRYSVEDGIMVA